MSGDEVREKPSRPYRTAEFQSPYAPLIAELYREEVLEARRMPPEEKFLLGEELFDYACSITLEGIRNQNPGFTDEDCRRELDRRLELGERMERAK
jgi:hypothetical protein